MYFECIRPYKEYIKVTLSGLLAAAIIQSIFVFLTNVDTLRVIPENGGIKCWAKETSDDKYCEDTVADIMYSSLNPDSFDNTTNVTNTSIFQTTTMESTASYFNFLISTTMIEYRPEWECGLHTDFRNVPFFETFLFTFTSAETYLVILVTFTFVYVFFAMTHDWTLIYYKNDLSQVSFLPASRKDLVLMYCLPSCCMNGLDKFGELACDSGCCYCVLLAPLSVFYIIIRILLGIYLLIDLLFAHTIMPFIWFVQSIFGKQQRYSIWTISYISASWVGIARFWMSISTTYMIFKSILGFSFKIPAWDHDKCQCECVYIFDEWDWYKLFFTTSLFVLVNVKFLWSWTMEAAHGKHYLYLITHTLPIEHANNINPVECTGSMMRDIGNDKVKQEMVIDMVIQNPKQVATYLAISAKLHEVNEEKNGEGKHEEGGIELQPVAKSNKDGDEHVKNEEELEAEWWDKEDDRRFNFLWRAIVLVLAVLYYMLAGGGTLLALVINNYYGYPYWALFVGSMIAVLILVGGVYGEFKAIGYLQKLYDKERYG